MLEQIKLQSALVLASLPCAPALSPVSEKFRLTQNDIASMLFAAGPCWAWSLPKGSALVCAGLAKRYDGQIEAWFSSIPEVKPYLREFIRSAHLTIDIFNYYLPHPIMARVSAGHKPGARIAFLLGFRHDGDDETGHEIWRRGL